MSGIQSSKVSGLQGFLTHCHLWRNDRDHKKCPLFISWVSAIQGCLLRGFHCISQFHGVAFFLLHICTYVRVCAVKEEIFAQFDD